MPRHLFAKILVFLVILVVILSVTAYFLAEPILLSIAQKELHKIFKESSIAGIKITTNYIEFHGIEIKESGSYDLKVKEARVYYSIASIFKKKMDKIEAFNLNISSLKTDLFEIEGIILNAARNQAAGEFYIKTINYNKLKIGDVAGKTELKGNLLYIRPLFVSFLGGNVKGEFNISLDQDMNYDLRLNSQGLEIKKLVDEMKFNEKFNMTGRLEGEFYLSGKIGEIKNIKGSFRTDNSGGTLVINDKTFLEYIAKQSNQPLDIIVESFRNYNYNNGIINLGMENNSLIMSIKLDGNAGKRSLTVVLHDFK